MVRVVSLTWHQVVGRLCQFHLLQSDKSVWLFCEVQCGATTPARPPRAPARDPTPPHERLLCTRRSWVRSKPQEAGNARPLGKFLKEKQTESLAGVHRSRASQERTAPSAPQNPKKLTYPRSARVVWAAAPTSRLAPEQLPAVGGSAPLGRQEVPPPREGAAAAVALRWLSASVWGAEGVVRPPKPSGARRSCAAPASPRNPGWQNDAWDAQVPVYLLSRKRVTSPVWDSVPRSLTIYHGGSLWWSQRGV